MLIEHGIYDSDIDRYILGTLGLVFQGMIEKIKAILNNLLIYPIRTKKRLILN